MVIDADTVRERVRPPDLRDVRPPGDLPAFRTLDAVRDKLGAFEWGPTGSVGFALATGVSCVRAGSDLDVAVFLDHLDVGSLPDLPVGVDCLLETPGGAVALAELISGSDRVMMKTTDGPRLIDRSTVTS